MPDPSGFNILNSPMVGGYVGGTEEGKFGIKVYCPLGFFVTVPEIGTPSFPDG